MSLSLHDGGFQHGSVFHSYDEIAHLYFLAERTDVRMNFLKVDETNAARLEVELKDGAVLTEFVEEKMFLIGLSQNKETEIKNVFELYALLSERTFLSRLQAYEREIQERGYFTYLAAKGAKFFPGRGLVLSDGSEHLFSDYTISRLPFLLIFNRKFGDSLGAKMRSKWLSRPIEIQTLVDQDIFLALLEKYYGLHLPR